MNDTQSKAGFTITSKEELDRITQRLAELKRGIVHNDLEAAARMAAIAADNERLNQTAYEEFNPLLAAVWDYVAANSDELFADSRDVTLSDVIISLTPRESLEYIDEAEAIKDLRRLGYGKFVETTASIPKDPLKKKENKEVLAALLSLTPAHVQLIENLNFLLAYKPRATKSKEENTPAPEKLKVSKPQD